MPGEKAVGRVVVAGSINMDILVLAPRLPRLGETIQGTDVKYFPGGKGANQSIAAARLGAPVKLIGRIGADAFGRELWDFLSGQRIDLYSVLETQTPSGTAAIILAGSENAIIVVPGANAFVSEADVSAPALLPGDVLVSQFEIPQSSVRAFFARGKTLGLKTILNAAPAIPFDKTLLALVDVLIVNEIELATLTGKRLANTDPIEHFVEGARSLRTHAAQAICVTLGDRGAVAITENEAIAMPAPRVKAVDTTGAGDCFVGAVAASLAKGSPIRAALGYATIAASICVQRMGAGPAMPNEQEVSAVIAGGPSSIP
jgi:ribokinase